MEGSMDDLDGALAAAREEALVLLALHALREIEWQGGARDDAIRACTMLRQDLRQELMARLEALAEVAP